ncbi:hypothetical protein [Perlucidibaca piscinae]|uniref:hypothetical protein n=1 Tax=Perlucidibaca piscinae TaxID=392589 RepID=UPI0003B33A9F|nr:hypothetical protein [Perlucidibaca piscinae]
MGTFNQIAFVRDEIAKIPGISSTPAGGVGSFLGRVGQAGMLALREKEILVFALLQWLVIALAYLLWVQMLDWIPEEVWRSAAESDKGSVADLVLLAWSFFCVGVAAYPLGILSGCMGAAHFLHRQGRESTVADCMQLVLPQSWPLWAFHWIDGWITVNQILKRLPRKNDRRSAAQKAASEALYYAWKLGISGILPSIVSGNGLLTSGRQSVVFVKDNLGEVARLRAGYSALCWIVGIAAYAGAILMFMRLDLVPRGEAVYQHVYTIYFWAAVPLLLATGVVLMLLRPVYVLALCDLYSDHLQRRGETVTLPEPVPAGVGAFFVFSALCFLLAVVFLFRHELGVMDLLAVPYGR